ncbi:hypothetical protein D046_6678B, partial [Vibrio parahaemolyticus V-223/04]
STVMVRRWAMRCAIACQLLRRHRQARHRHRMAV